jgi:hypothetical protein
MSEWVWWVGGMRGSARRVDHIVRRKQCEQHTLQNDTSRHCCLPQRRPLSSTLNTLPHHASTIPQAHTFYGDGLLGGDLDILLHAC